MNDPMTILKADHREVKQLLKSLADSSEGREREASLEQLSSALTLHMQIEEQLLYPLVKQNVGAEDEEEAEIEHGLAREGLEKALSMRSAPGFGAVIEMLQAGIEHHVKEEEGEILPELKDSMERADWLALGDAIARQKAEAGMPVNGQKTTRRSSKRSTTSSRR